jgi:hypothetical protein
MTNRKSYVPNVKDYYAIVIMRDGRIYYCKTEDDYLRLKEEEVEDQ